jgi:hypothetical protein
MSIGNEFTSKISKIELAFVNGSREARREVLDDIGFLTGNRPQEARSTFLKFLNKKDGFWAVQALSYFMGEKFTAQSELAKITKEIASDKSLSSNLRVKSVALLGHGLTENDPILIDLITNENDIDVQNQAFSALIEIRTDYWTGQDAYERADSGELKPTLENAEKIVEEWKAQNA